MTCQGCLRFLLRSYCCATDLSLLATRDALLGRLAKAHGGNPNGGKAASLSQVGMLLLLCGNAVIQLALI